MPQEDATEIYVDNKSVIDLAKNIVYHDRAKLINTCYHFIQECIAKNNVQVIHTRLEDQVQTFSQSYLRRKSFQDSERCLELANQV